MLKAIKPTAVVVLPVVLPRAILTLAVFEDAGRVTQERF